MISKRLLVRRSLLALAVTAAILSCADPSPVSVNPLGLTAQRVAAHGLISCTPLPYDSVTQVIGPGGGIIVVGGHVLVVDSLALSILGYLQTWSKINKNPWSQGQQWVAGELPHFSNYAVAW